MRRPSLKRLERAVGALMQLVELDPVYLPILERLEDELAVARRREAARQAA